MTSSFYHSLKNMALKNDSFCHVIEADVLILGSGAGGCGAAMGARSKGANVVLIDKGKLESSGCLGGGHDHFMAVLHTGPSDSTEAVVNFIKGPMSGVTEKMIEEGWVKMMPTILDIMLEVGVEFVKNEDGSWLRTPGMGSPGDWFINIENGQTIKKRLGKKIRDMGIEVIDHIMVTKLLKEDDRIAGCVGINVLDGSFYVLKAKKVVLALGNVASRGWDNSTGNPYNIMWPPFNTGSQFTLSYDAGVKLLNLELQFATLLPKGFGAPGMNGLNSMGGYEFNALGERFMGKYDPVNWENCPRMTQVLGTYQEQVEGKGPPFWMDMTHLKKEDVHHLQYVLMPGDKATYLDWCEQRGIDFAQTPLEIEVSELNFMGLLMTHENFETDLSGLYNGCVFFNFSGSMCGGYYAGLQAAEASLGRDGFGEINETEVIQEKDRVLRPLQVEEGISYQEFEKAVRQVMNYYMGYRRNQKGMEIALDRLQFLEGYLDQIKASDYRQLMRANESVELVKMCRLTTEASMERKESGRAFYLRTDYPDLNPDLNMPLIVWQENGEQKFSWGL